MSRTWFATDGHIGTDFEAALTSKDFDLGEVFRGNKNSLFTFVSANSAIAVGDFVAIDEDHSANPATTANAQDAHNLGVAVAALAAGEYGFIALEATDIPVKCKDGVTADSALYVSSTAGVVQITANAASVDGIVAVSANSSGTTATRGVILKRAVHQF